MNLADMLTETWLALTTNKVRSGLTMLGVIIGIASIVSLIAIGQGATNAVRRNITALGSNLLVISPSATAADASSNLAPVQVLTLDDAAALRTEVGDLSAVAATASGVFTITAGRHHHDASVIGAQADYDRIRNITMSRGNFFTSEQDMHAAKVVILGAQLAQTLFTDPDQAIGQTVRINQLEYLVIGVAQAKGGTESGSSDAAAFVPLSNLRRYLIGLSEPIQAIYASAANEKVLANAQAETTSLLMSRHHNTDEHGLDFKITSQTDIAQSLTASTRTLTILLGAIAGISLLVGGIGIMNMMLMSVTERTREIGLRKAIGATQRSIREQFLLEAISQTMTGGLLGIILGFGIVWGLTASHITEADITAWSILLALSVNLVVGIVFGYYPARRAAKLNPIQALKYE